ncbi:MAG: tail fiber assembly protein [Leclercia adecarboxylata]|nr:tail fiber assembly protein [Leclercia adecarboxylata]MDU1082761.1 tail fiber assembly protein [Leclercia adecarboxylata]
MESKIYYSASKGGFYFEVDKAACMQGAGWPDDVKEISQRWYDYLLAGQTGGKNIIPDEYGMPVLAEIPIDYVGAAESEKSQRLAQATVQIAPLQDAVDLGIATDVEAAQLSAWKMYRVEVNRIDTSTAPEIEWPSSPTS